MPKAGINNFIARGINALEVESRPPSKAEPTPLPPWSLVTLFCIDWAAAWSCSALAIRPSAL